MSYLYRPDLAFAHCIDMPTAFSMASCDWFSLRREVRDWLDHNIGDMSVCWTYWGSNFCFVQREHAMRFKLVWGGQ